MILGIKTNNMAIQIIPNYRKAYRGILQEPDPRLRKVSNKVSAIDGIVLDMATKLMDTLEKIDKPYIPWLGMAAPQLGYNFRIVAIKTGFQKYQVMINPEIVEKKWILPTISSCYSLTGLYLINSPYWSKIRYMDLKGKLKTEVFKGGMAILMKQEIDHLNGKLICD